MPTANVCRRPRRATPRRSMARLRSPRADDPTGSAGRSRSAAWPSSSASPSPSSPSPAAGRAPSIAVGYMPTDTVSYGEYRLDLPGDQRGKMAAFLAKFPGFADQANVQTKLDEVFDRIVGAATENEQTYTANIEPWFGGQIAMGSGAARPGRDPRSRCHRRRRAAGHRQRQGSGQGHRLASFDARATPRSPQTQHDGATCLFTGSATEPGPRGLDRRHRQGDHRSARTLPCRPRSTPRATASLAQDAEFKAAFGTSPATTSASLHRLPGDAPVPRSGSPHSRIGRHGPCDRRSSWRSVPAWTGQQLPLRGRRARRSIPPMPSIDSTTTRTNKESSAPRPGARRTRSSTPSRTTSGRRSRRSSTASASSPSLEDGFAQFDTAIGVVGGFDGLLGWWGDAAIAVSKTADGSIGGGLLIEPTDPVAAERTVRDAPQLRRSCRRRCPASRCGTSTTAGRRSRSSISAGSPFRNRVGPTAAARP